MKNLLKKLSRDERGVSALEYAILAAVILGAVIVGIQTLGQRVNTALTTAVTEVEKVTGTTPADQTN